jgi:hypothetical protein
MAIMFDHAKVRGNWRITSPQIPGWACSAPTKEAALAQIPASLRAHLRYADDLDPWVRRQLEAMVLG